MAGLAHGRSSQDPVQNWSGSLCDVPEYLLLRPPPPPGWPTNPTIVGRIRAKFGRFRANSGRNLSRQMWPAFREVWSNSGQFWTIPGRLRSGRSRSNLAELGPNLARFRHMLDHFGPWLAEEESDLADVGPTSGHFWSTWRPSLAEPCAGRKPDTDVVRRRPKEEHVRGPRFWTEGCFGKSLESGRSRLKAC